jgi:hypothetical protein
LRRFAVLGLLALLLTACEMRTWLEIDLSDPAAGQVRVTVGFDQQLREMIEQAGGGGEILGQIESEAAREGWAAEPFVDGEIEGVVISQSFTSIAELDEVLGQAPSLGGNQGGSMVDGVSVTDTGDTIRFQGSIPGASGQEFEGVKVEEFLGSVVFDARVSVTFPGDVIDHNGELEGRTVTWRFFEDDLSGVEMFAEARKGAGVPWALIGGVGLGLLVAAVVWYRLRASTTPAVTSGAGPVETVPAPESRS